MTQAIAKVVLAIVLGTGLGAGVEPADDTSLRTRVEAALESATDVDSDRITVEANEGVVTLTGQVASGTEQQSVGAIVRAVPGVEDVRFSLVIAP